MIKTIDIHDLTEEQVKLVQEFVEFLRKKFSPKQIVTEKMKEKEWAILAIASFAEDWENEKDAVYDNWKELYHVS
ncbi:MAG: hypothetical protein HZA78_01165 [Candidatus Schekmanbacteria bacterium]|nr:hypothetical protein [Candidatus Schekmanbacteria bacterium]